MQSWTESLVRKLDEYEVDNIDVNRSSDGNISGVEASVRKTRHRGHPLIFEMTDAGDNNELLRLIRIRDKSGTKGTVSINQLVPCMAVLESVLPDRIPDVEGFETCLGELLVEAKQEAIHK